LSGIVLSLLLVQLVVGPAGCRRAPQPVRGRVVLLGLDAATWRVAVPMMGTGRLPALECLVRNGARATLSTLKPTVSVVIWTSVATGRLPPGHGITNWTAGVKNTAGGQHAISSADRQAPALWDMTTSRQRSNLVVNWWATWPAEAIRGLMITNRAFQDDVDRRIYPPERVDLLQPRPLGPAAVLHPWGIDRTRATGERRETSLPAFMSERLSKELGLADLSLELLGSEQPDLAMIYFRALDLLGHELWDTIDTERFPEPPPERAREQRLIERYYRFFDRYVARLIELFGEDQTLILVSDHGMEPKLRLPPPIESLNLNRLLQRLGLQRLDSRGLIDEQASLAMDLERYPPGPARGLRILGPPERRAANRRRVEETLGALRDVTSGAPLFTRIGKGHLEGEDLRLELNMELGRDALVRWEGKELRLGELIDMILHPRAGQHWEAPHGVLLAAGPAIRPAATLPEATVLDIAPTVLALMGLPLAEDLDGKVLEAALRRDRLPAWPPPRITRYPFERRPAPRVDAGEADEEELEELRALGYVAK